MNSIASQSYNFKEFERLPKSDPCGNYKITKLPLRRPQPLYKMEDEDKELRLRAEIEKELLKRANAFPGVQGRPVASRQSCNALVGFERPSNAMIKDDLFEDGEE